MKTFRVKLTRLLEEECFIYVAAANAEAASESALNDAGEIEPIWERTRTAPQVMVTSAHDMKDMEALRE